MVFSRLWGFGPDEEIIRNWIDSRIVDIVTSYLQDGTIVVEGNAIIVDAAEPLDEITKRESLKKAILYNVDCGIGKNGQFNKPELLPDIIETRDCLRSCLVELDRAIKIIAEAEKPT